MNQKRKNNLFCDIVKRISMESTCVRVQVGAVLVKNDRIIATGWNGVAPGAIHCNEIFKDNVSLENHHTFSIMNELHAEQNLISFCAKNGICTFDTILYLTIAPCIHCAKLILACGIKEVIYIEKYDREDMGIQFLKNNSIQIQKY